MLNDSHLGSAEAIVTARTTPLIPAAPAQAPGALPLRTHLRIPIWPFALLAAILIGLFLLTLALGSVQIPLDQILKVLAGGEADREAWTNIVLKFRLPKALTAMLAGGALGVAGLMMQTFFRNPLASPDVLGVHAGASLGVALVVLTTGSIGGEMLAGIGLAGDVSLAAAASLGAALTIALVLLVARRAQNSATLLLLGLMIGQFTAAFVSLLLYFSVPERIQAYVNWGFGSFSGVSWAQMPILVLAVVAGLLLAGVLGKSLNAMLLGETYARSLGLNVQRTRIGIIVATALLTGAVTAFCGPIVFIGIAVPHACRGLLRTSDHRALIVAAILAGAAAALAAGLIAELPGARIVLPLNAVTALFGAPVVLWIILRWHGAGKVFTS
ncbi:MAG: iron ABC transporter permease [Anaerolineae bacterium]|nr:iron ABC transporter permease [Anaerolineae bacterium]